MTGVFFDDFLVKTCETSLQKDVVESLSHVRMIRFFLSHICLLMQKQHDPGCFVINRLEKYGNAIHRAPKIPWLRNEDLEFAVPFPLIREGQLLPTFTNSYINPT